MNQVKLARRERRRRRRSTTLLVVTIVAAVVAVACVGAALVLRSDTTEVRSQAEPVHQQLREVAANAVDAERRLATLREKFPRNRLMWLESGSTNLRAGNTLFVDGGSHINGAAWAPDLPDHP